MDYAKMQDRLDEIETEMQSDEPVDDETANRLMVESAFMFGRVMVDIAASLNELADAVYGMRTG